MTENRITDALETPLPGLVESDLFELEMTDFGSAYALDNAAGACFNCQCICNSCLCVCIALVAEDA